jgi:hypothetical protein
METPLAAIKRKSGKFLQILGRKKASPPAQQNTTSTSSNSQDDKDTRVCKKLKLNDEFVTKQRNTSSLHQSVTFIADLASTSTPTRATFKPITSTPNTSTHNPLKYHPTQTIRNKQQKRKPNTNKAINISITSCVNCANIEHSTPSKRNLIGLRNKFKIKRITLEEISSKKSKCRLLCQQQPHNMQLKSKPIKYKSSKIEISLEDLLYTPRNCFKQRRQQTSASGSFKSSNAVRMSSRMSTSTLVSLATPVVTTSKVYFL